MQKIVINEKMLKQAFNKVIDWRALAKKLTYQGWGLVFEFFIYFFILTILLGSAPVAFILYILWKITVLGAIVDFFESIPYVGPFVTVVKDVTTYIVDMLYFIASWVLGSFSLFMVLVFVITVAYQLNAAGHLDHLFRPK